MKADVLNDIYKVGSEILFMVEDVLKFYYYENTPDDLYHGQRMIEKVISIFLRILSPYVRTYQKQKYNPINDFNTFLFFNFRC